MSDANQPSEKPKTLPVRKKDTINETIRTMVYAILIALVVRTFTYQPFNIPSGSMIPTLLVGDYLFASKFAYGYSEYSFPIDLPLFSGRVFGQQPERGDIVIFKFPKDNSTDYIKRVIGLPGDHIKIVHGQLYIDGKAVERKKMPDYVDESGHHTLYMETLPNGVKHQILQDGNDGALDNCPGNPTCTPRDNAGEYVVPPNHYFCMGDNRTNSADSRVLNEVGYVPYVNLEARAGFIFFSLSEDAHFWEIWKWPWDLRISRMFSTAK